MELQFSRTKDIAEIPEGSRTTTIRLPNTCAIGKSLRFSTISICQCSLFLYQLRQSRCVRWSFDDESTATLVHAFVAIRVDYCCSLLYRRINHLSISPSHLGQLSLLPSAGREMCTSQSAMRPFESCCYYTIHPNTVCTEISRACSNGTNECTTKPQCRKRGHVSDTCRCMALGESSLIRHALYVASQWCTEFTYNKLPITTMPRQSFLKDKTTEF